jgi:hypothetical protein
MPIFEKISLSKEWFEEGKKNGLTFSEIMEREGKKAAKFAEDSKLNVLQQQLAARNLQLSGAHAALVDDFFKTEDNRLLFVETLNQFVKLGMLEELASFVGLTELVATSTGIDGTLYEDAEVDVENSTGTAKRVAESAEFPTVSIKFKEKALKLHKIGYKIAVSYEAMRRMKLNVFGVTMKVLGRNITKAKVGIAVDVLINGDGNSNPISSINAATPGTLAYADIVNLEEDFANFEPNLMIATKALRVAYRNLSEYKDKNGPAMPEPPKKCSDVPAGKIIALDTKASLEEVYEKGGSMVEYDKIITKQINEAVVSEVSGYSKLFTEASRMLNV